jgi:hypothetical protein
MIMHYLSDNMALTPARFFVILCFCVLFFLSSMRGGMHAMVDWGSDHQKELVCQRANASTFLSPPSSRAWSLSSLSHAELTTHSLLGMRGCGRGGATQAVSSVWVTRRIAMTLYWSLA